MTWIRAISRRTLVALASVAIVASAGLYGKRYYHGPAEHWVHDSLGGVSYEILWCLVLAICRPKWPEARIAAAVLAVTCVLEFLQLWHPPLLESLRANFLGRTILGSTFDWSDFTYYFVGSALGYLWLRLMPPLQ